MRFSSFIWLFAVLLVAGPAAAQGTEQQRAACERDAHRLCAAEEPDAIAVENCLRANMKTLSSACRRQFRAPRR
ncbi:MAG: hypothetical protein CTY15_07905 [Methylocystis sp.]|nr:MAG: hypothetical protein CTY15_07905 [Methylocystis sp.]